ncbi:MAG: polyphosphate kinase 1, partial [Gemmatimonadetes bacterium]|nr:polyphosphate kinase 1 [Gemmatimonadota bacterium]
MNTPADLVPPPVPGEDGAYDLDDAALYLNRELTWLNFNFRVLAEARNERTPLLERIKFISIVGSNLDEFFMKRIGGLKQLVTAGIQDVAVDGRTPEEQMAEASDLVAELEARLRQSFDDLLPALEAEGIVVRRFEDLAPEHKEEILEEYVTNIYPLVTPQATDSAHPFPFVSNLSLNLLVTLRHPGDTQEHLARVKVPTSPGVNRFLRTGDGTTFVPLESVMAADLDRLFPGMEVVACEFFRATRNANTEKDEESADDLVEMIEAELRERRLAPIVRVAIGTGMDRVHKGLLAAELGLDEVTDVFEVTGLLGMRDVSELMRVDRADLKDTQHHPVDHPDLTTPGSIFYTIREKGSLLLRHPYQSFASSVERFLEEASQDPKVRAIKMTFYRTSGDSKAVHHLMEAARNGKQVAVVMEIKARFDEEANLGWAHDLASVGIHVTYGVVGLKTHCKTVLVVRQDFDGLRRYAHIATGNYHAGTARHYCDLGLLTCDPAIGADLTELFNYLTTGYKPSRNYQRVLTAPKGLKDAILEKIDREIEHQRSGQGGLIQFKLNALEDVDVCRSLYRASQAGVKVDLVVRDTCRVRPGLPGLSESMRVVSIVGRFLEHGRIYYFGNAGDEEYYIGSADAMRRNLESRVEILAPVERPELREELRFLLDTQLADAVAGWQMQPDGSYVRRPSDSPDDVDSQTA